MKKKTKKKIEKYCRLLFIYAILPIFCFVSLSLCVFVNYADADGIYDINDFISSPSLFKALTDSNNIFSVLYHSFSSDGRLGTGALPVLPATNPQSALLLPQESPSASILPPENVFPVIKSYRDGKSEFTNTTGYSVYPERLIQNDYPIEKNVEGELPLVLIVHTHTTESYYDTDNAYSSVIRPNSQTIGFYSESTPTRTEDTEKNVVHIGRIFAERLEGYGVKTVHCTVFHDDENFNLAYNYAAKTIEEYLKRYPSIKYVIDIHRDSLIRANGEKLCPVADVDGEETAQVMLVVGTDYSGSYHPNWQKNLTVALKLEKIISEKCAGASRGVYLRTAKFNQQYSVGSLLLEIGSCGNTLEQAERAAVLTSDAFYELLKENHTFI